MHSDSTFLPWLAGFVDGEGCFHIQLGKGGRYGCHSAKITITNTYRPVLESIQARCGGSIQALTRPRKECKQGWYWIVNGAAAVGLAAQLAPLLQVKRDVATVLASFPLIPAPGRTHSRAPIPADVYAERECLRLELNTLNRKGTQGTVNSY